MIRAVFLAGLLLLGLVGVLLLYRISVRKIDAEAELKKREMEHEERTKLFEDEEL